MALASEKLETGLKGGGSQGSVFPSQLCLAFILQILPKWWARRSLTAILPSFAAPRKPFPSVCKAILKWTLLVLFWILCLQHPSVITEPGGTGYFDKSGSRGSEFTAPSGPREIGKEYPSTMRMRLGYWMGRRHLPTTVHCRMFVLPKWQIADCHLCVYLSKIFQPVRLCMNMKYLASGERRSSWGKPCHPGFSGLCLSFFFFFQV